MDSTVKRLGIGIVFLIGAVIYLVNLIISLARRSTWKPIPVDGVGLMVLGIGIALFF
jgi:hypothetical protein